jgi:hypothetical protein
MKNWKTNNSVKFKFMVGQEVFIKPLETIQGVVYARCDRGNFKDYRIVYWFNGARHDEWLYENELSAKRV